MKLSVYCQKCGRLVTVEGKAGDSVRCLCHSELQVPEGQDVFVSYSKPDFSRVAEVAAEFTKEGINFWLAPVEIGPGAAFPAEISRALDCAKILVLILSVDSMQSHWVEREVLTAHDKKITVIPLLLQQLDGAEKLEIREPWRLILKTSQRTDSISKLIAEIHRQLPKRDDPEEKAIYERLRAEALPVVLTQPRGINRKIRPYVGPTPYKEGSTHRLYGRFAAARELCLAIRRNRLTLVYAPSGAGKSSLFNTLVERTFSGIALGYKVHSNLRVGTTTADMAEKTNNLYSYSTISSFNDAGAHPEITLTEYLATRSADHDAPRRILIFDQFEELFTQYAEPFTKASELHRQRETFLDDLMAALKADKLLHVVLVIREEYLAPMNRWLKMLAADLKLYRFPLSRLNREQARDTITSPAAEYAVYDKELVDEILDQLEADGAIEMVHLQIVCQRLWEILPEGITQITKSHVENAEGAGGTCQGFVKNAVRKFYENVVHEVAKSQHPPAGSSEFPEKLIYLGCRKFVGSQSTRAVLQRDRERTGRLPNWIVKELEDKHLLRSESRGEGVWYELSHDLLIQSVKDQSDPDVNALLYAAELLDTTIAAARDRNRQSLASYFAPHGDLLRASHPFKSQLVLFDDEVEFIFRASLVAGGEEMVDWSDLLEKNTPELQKGYHAIHRQVLNEALAARAIPGLLTKEEAAFTRRNAAILLGERPAITGLLELLTDVALSDEDNDTRSAAAFALVQRQDAEKNYGSVIDKLQRNSAADGALDTLARMRVAADRIRPAENQLESAPVFKAAWAHLAWNTRLNARMRGWLIRLKEGASAVPYIFFPAAVLSASVASVWKSVFAAANWGICMAKPSIGMGLFHGITAAVIWGGGIALALALYGLIFRTEQRGNNAFRPVGALLMGALAGFCCSAALVLLIASVYDPHPLKVMGWITKDVGRFEPERMAELFYKPGFAWPYLITGTGLGVGMAMMTNGVLASRRWLRFLDEEHGELSGFRHVLKLIGRITRIALPWFIFIPPVLVLSAALAYGFMLYRGNLVPNEEVRQTLQSEDDRASAEAEHDHKKPPHPNNVECLEAKANPDGLINGLVADCSTQACGSFLAVVGMGFGMVIMRRGFRVKPRSDKPWRSAPLKLPDSPA